MQKTQMKAMVLPAINKPLVLQLINKPVPGIGQVLVKICHSGINPLDLKISQGKADHAQVRLPAVLGIDMAGTVEEIGDGVTKFAVGDEVFGMVGGIGNNQGTLAAYIIVDSEHIALKSDNISMKEAAAMPLVFITAWEGLVDRAKVKAGQKVLVHGGAGGVGHMAVQIAQFYGADVYATASGKDLDYLKSLGVTAIDFTQLAPADYLATYTNSEGFDIVFDTVGGPILDASFRSVKSYTGHVVSSLGWGTHSIAPLSFKAATYSGIFTLLPLLTGAGKSHHGAILSHATAMADAGKLTPIVDSSDFQLTEINQAYAAITEKRSFGKVVINVLK